MVKVAGNCNRKIIRKVKAEVTCPAYPPAAGEAGRLSQNYLLFPIIGIIKFRRLLNGGVAQLVRAAES